MKENKAIDKPRILLVEDEQGISLSFSMLLEDSYKVTTAACMAEATAKLSSDFAVIILDLWLPDVEGFELLDFVRQNQPAIPAIIFTAETSRKTVDEAYRRGAAGIVEKPFTRADVVNAIERAIKESKEKEYDV
jgi:DNA-binding NtrC family response regulator